MGVGQITLRLFHWQNASEIFKYCPSEKIGVPPSPFADLIHDLSSLKI
jgi:hypothetical protein